jgi:hypothetical protein
MCDYPSNVLTALLALSRKLFTGDFPMRNRTPAIGAILITLFMLASTDASFAKRHWTVTERQQALLAEINTAQKANQLTLKEADNLRDDQRKIVEKEQSMKDKNGGKLSVKDNTSLERSLNDLSNRLHKKVLDKRVQ